MQVIKYPVIGVWEQALRRPVIDSSSLEKKVKKILDTVKKNGDKGVKKYSKEFDGIKPGKFQVTEKEINQAGKLISPGLKEAIGIAADNIGRFHAAQLQPASIIETMPGVSCWRKNVAIEKIGLYIPGGTAPLFSTILMLGVPAKLAGCREVVLCSPPSPRVLDNQDGTENKDGYGLHPAIVYAATLVGIKKIFRVGGVQAIGAMAFGTETVPQVNKIFGPGNQYVTCAKQLVQQSGTAIDMPAGPSEVAVYADETANPAWVAADLLSQAEHGVDSQVLLVVNQESMIGLVIEEITKQLQRLPRKEFAEKSLENSNIILVKNDDEAIELLNEYAPEHLILSCREAGALAERVINAGSVFIGNFSPESAGDYASGTNHVLPTNGFARTYSGVSMDSFVKKITFQKLSEEGLKNIGKAIITMAEAEGLAGHAEAVRIRMNVANP